MFAELHVERGRICAILPCISGSIIRTETDTFDFPGCHILPGFVDNHAHIVGLGERLSCISLHDAESVDDCIQRLSTGEPLANGWIRAMGWNQEHWESHRWPTRAELDGSFPDTPVVASRVDGHAMWVNSAALLAAGIDPISHSGILIDDEMSAIWEAIPRHSDDDLRRMILASTSLCSQMGITEVHDMDVAVPWLDIFRQLAEEGALPVRVQSFVRGQNNEWLDAGLLPAGGEFHRLAGIKMFADGALGSRGALLRLPYNDDPSTSGIALLSTSQMVERIRVGLDAGWTSIAIHAIGDEAIRRVLDAYTEVRSWQDGKDAILRIEHVQHLHPDDLMRMSDLRVVACVQPSHCLSDANMAMARLGVDRCAWAYRWRSLIDAGILIGAGSDFPIESPDVLAGIAAFVERRPEGAAQAWQPQERITQTEALLCYTRDAHVTSGMDYRRGLIAVGYDADLVILDRDIDQCAIADIGSSKVLATFVAGKRRYGT